MKYCSPFGMLCKVNESSKPELLFCICCFSADENATPENPAIRKSLSSMLTPYIAKQLSNDSPKEVHCALIKISFNIWVNHFQNVNVKLYTWLLLRLICDWPAQSFMVTSTSAHLEKFNPNFSSLSFAIRVNLLHPQPSLFLYGLLLSLCCFSISLNYYFQVPFSLKVILFVVKTAQNTVWLSSFTKM